MKMELHGFFDDNLISQTGTNWVYTDAHWETDNTIKYIWSWRLRIFGSKYLTVFMMILTWSVGNYNNLTEEKEIQTIGVMTMILEAM